MLHVVDWCDLCHAVIHILQVCHCDRFLIAVLIFYNTITPSQSVYDTQRLSTELKICFVILYSAYRV